MSILELLQHIVNEPAPRLTPEGRFPKAAEDFVDGCLLKDPEARKPPKELLVSGSSGPRIGVLFWLMGFLLAAAMDGTFPNVRL